MQPSSVIRSWLGDSTTRTGPELDWLRVTQAWCMMAHPCSSEMGAENDWRIRDSGVRLMVAYLCLKHSNKHIIDK